MAETFYWNYLIDTAGYGCWKIINVQCDWLGNLIHAYIDPCELLKQCGYTPFDISEHWDEIIWDLWLNPWEVLIVNPWGTSITSVPASSLFPTEAQYMVKRNALDPVPWYLWDKLFAGNNVTFTPWLNWYRVNATIPTNAISFLDLTDTPNAYPWCDWVVRVNAAWWLSFQCDNSIYWATRYLPSNTPIPAAQNQSVFSVVNTSVYSWAPWMSSTYLWVPSIKILKTWLYHLWIHVKVKVYPWVQAIRFFIHTSNAMINCLECKEGDEPWDLVPTGRTYVTRTLDWQNLVPLNAWDELVLGARILATPSSPSVPTAEFEYSWLPLDTPFPAWSPWKRCGTSFGAALYSTTLH